MNNTEKIIATSPNTLRITERGRKIRNGLVLAAGVGLAAFIGYEIIKAPEFSAETTDFTFTEEQDDLWSAAQQIEGLGDPREGVTHIESMPENKDALSDGIQLGETISIPVSASK